MSIRKWLGGIIRPDGVETEEVESEKVSIPDTSSDPTSNGEITRNGSDIKVHSGDSVLSASNIGSGSGSPGGSDGQIQFNNSGSFGGISGFVFGGTNITSIPDIDSFLTLVDQASNPTSNGQIGLNGSDIIVYTGGATLNLSNVGTSGFSNEDAQDAVGGILSSDFTYDDANDAINMSPHVGTSDAHHADPTAGTGITDEGTNKFGVADGGIGTTQLNTPFTDIATLFGSPATAGGALQFGDGVKTEYGAAQDAAIAYEATPDLLDITGKDVRFSALTGTPTMGGHDHSEGGMTVVPNAGLSNSDVTVAGNTVSLGGSTSVAHGDLSDAPTNAHHQDPSAGTGLTDEGTNQFGVATGGVTDTELGVDAFSYDPGHTNWSDGLSNEEINRIVLQSGETLAVERIEFRQKTGGSSSSASIDVRDTSAGTTIGSQNLGGTTKDPGSSGTGNTVIVRVNNSTGSDIDAAPRVEGYITGA
jgi:hypothetical protein